MQSLKAEGDGLSKLKERTWTPWLLSVSHLESDVLDEVQITKSWRGMRLCSRMASRVALPSFPVQLVKASILRLF